MKCNGFGLETYSLYAIGALAVEESERVLEHLTEGCSTCRKGIRDSLNFWYTFAVGTTPHPAQAPAGLRERIIESVPESSAGPRKRVLSLPATPFWRQVAAACLVLGVLSAVLWEETSHRTRNSGTSPQQATVRNGAVSIPADDRLKQQLAEAQHTVEDLRGSISGFTAREAELEHSAALSRTRSEEQDRALAALRLESNSAAAALAQAQTRAEQLDDQIRRINAEHASAVARLEQARQDAESRSQLAAADRARAVEDRARLVEQVRNLSAKNQDLERQVQEVRAVLNREQERVGPLLQLASIIGTPGLKPVLLRGTDRDRTASGTAFVVEGASVLVFFANLPALPANRTYQLWLMRRHNPGIVSGGIFTPDTQNRAFVRFDNGVFANGVTALAVTDEPAGGSPGPTGHKYLIGTQAQS